MILLAVRIRESLFILYLLMECFSIYAQRVIVLSREKVIKDGYCVKNCVYKEGDSLLWAKKEYDDRSWKEENLNEHIKKKSEGIRWYRLRIKLDKNLLNTPIVLKIQHNGASEIYVDGKFYRAFGKIDKQNLENSIGYDPTGAFNILYFSDTLEHLISVRYYYHQTQWINRFVEDNISFCFQIIEGSLLYPIEDGASVGFVFSFYWTFLITLAFVHLFLYLFYKQNKNNLYFTIFLVFYSAYFIFILVLGYSSMLVVHKAWIRYFVSELHNIYLPFLLATLLGVFYNRYNKWFWIYVGLCVSTILLSFSSNNYLYSTSRVFNSLGFVYASIVLIILCINAFKMKGKPFWIISVGVLIFIISSLIIFMIISIKGNFSLSANGIWSSILLTLIILSIPISTSIYLAWEYAYTNKMLTKKIKETEELSAKTLLQEKEKQEILLRQKETLEHLVQERTKEILHQKNIIEEKNKNITDSITYAKRIQTAILPSENKWKKLLPDSFVIYLPKDIVSGDFYWLEETEKYIYVAVADSTGHGVPGAMVSVICSSALTSAVLEDKKVNTNEILERAREIVLEKLTREGEHIRDGMDVCLIRINKNNPREIQYSGANRPLWIIVKNKELHQYQPDKQPVGLHEIHTPFTAQTIQVEKKDMVYLFTDGFTDQFGGEKNKKLGTKKLLEFMNNISAMELEQQKHALLGFFNEWKNGEEQTDDCCIAGIRIL